ncbi:MAG: hypothetical protein WDN26_12845 [Chitinophagaceae bacterium]
MNFDFKYLLEGNYPPSSRVWVYQASLLFSMSEAIEIEGMLKDFTSKWQSHGTPVKGTGYLLFGQFVILMVDEAGSGISGCSTDTSVRLMKDIEQRFNVSMFDRTMLAFIAKDKIQLLPLSQLQYAFDNGFIDADTLYFNNIVQTKEELEENWIIPLKKSWLTTRLSNFKSAY